MGIFARVCDQELAVHYPPRSSGQLQKTLTFLHKGMRLVFVHVYWLMIADWRILLHPVCSSFRMRHQPDDTFPSSEQHTEPPDCPIFLDGYGIQSWNVPRICLLPPVEFRYVYYNVGNGTIHELERRIENSSRNILLCPWWDTWMAVRYGSIGSILVRRNYLCVPEQQGCIYRDDYATCERIRVWTNYSGKPGSKVRKSCSNQNQLFEFVISGFFYKSLVLVPFNIVWYNIFSQPGKGPEIYGTEPWHFYIRNLLLNFNIWFVLACAALPLFTLQKLLSKSAQANTVTGLRSVIFMTPFYMWLAIFSFQPHKEERFMYPAYPCLALNGAMSLHIILAAFGQSDPKTLVGKIPAKLKLLIVSFVMIGSIDLGVARIYGIYSAYSAPLKIYEPLQTLGVYGESVCFGKEWYRFPSSYHLPKDMRAKFVKSEFSGLLPGEFSEAKTGFGHWSGAWLVPPGMNDQNIEDMGKYVSKMFFIIFATTNLLQTDIRACDFLVDTYYPGSSASELEPHYIKDTEHWEQVSCAHFLDASSTHILGRIIWVPDWPIIPEKYRRQWGEHCLLKKKATK